MVFCLLVDLEFSSPAQKEAWKALWGGLAKLVRSREPRCLMYEFSDSTEEGQECRGIIFERYVSASDLDAHRESQRVFDFNSQWTGGDLVAKKVTKWTESGIGHTAAPAATPRVSERTAGGSPP